MCVKDIEEKRIESLLYEKLGSTFRRFFAGFKDGDAKLEHIFFLRCFLDCKGCNG